LPTIAAEAFQAEQIRKVPDENIALLKGIGMHRAFQPKKFGGVEMSLPQFADCIALLAGVYARTAWAMSLLCTHSHQLVLYSVKLQEEIWGSDPGATASSIAPFGPIEGTEGGVLFSGDMGWSSSSDHAEWEIVGFAVLMINDIHIIQDLAVIASLGVAVLLFANLVLVPILLSYTGGDANAAQRSLKAESRKCAMHFGVFSTCLPLAAMPSGRLA